ncbi:MAG: SHOCT domain-containing protein [Erysipelotrichaceae bacterium]
MMYWNTYTPHMMGGWMVFGWLLFVALIILLVVAIVLLLQHKQTPNRISSTSLDALKLRYAKGEIDEEEYLRKKHILEDGM